MGPEKTLRYNRRLIMAKTRHQAILAFAMAYLRGRYNGGAFTKTVIDATMCAIIAWFIRDLLDFAGLK